MKTLPTPTLRTLTGGSIPDYTDGGGIYCPFPFPDNGVIGDPGPGPTTGDASGISPFWSGSFSSSAS